MIRKKELYNWINENVEACNKRFTKLEDKYNLLRNYVERKLKDELIDTLEKWKESHSSCKEWEWYNTALKELIKSSEWYMIYNSYPHMRLDRYGIFNITEDESLYNKYKKEDPNTVTSASMSNAIYYNDGTEDIRQELNGIKKEIKKFRKGDKK